MINNKVRYVRAIFAKPVFKCFYEFKILRQTYKKEPWNYWITVVIFLVVYSTIFHIYDIGSMIDTHEVHKYLNSRWRMKAVGLVLVVRYFMYINFR